MSAGASAAARAEQLRAGARRGLWRRVLAWLGLDHQGARMVALARRSEVGAVGEKATARLLAVLEREGWTVLHDRRLPWSRANLDHVLVPPSGRGLIVLDSKRWRRNWPTTVVRGRVHCGPEDRHEELEKLVGLARRAGEAVGVPGLPVLPVLVVHGSPVAGGHFTVPVAGHGRQLHVLGPERLVDVLRTVPGGPDPQRAAWVAARVEAALPPYGHVAT